jgi:hypothetical protein
MEWEAGIQRIAELEMSRLEQGDIILALAPLGKNGVNNGNMEKLGRISDETGMSISTLQTRRLVSAYFRGNRREFIDGCPIRLAYKTMRAVALDEGNPELKFKCLQQVVADAQESSKKHVTYDEYKTAWNEVYATEQERQKQITEGFRQIDNIGHGVSRIISWARLTKPAGQQAELALERMEKIRDAINLAIEALNPHSEIDWDAEMLRLDVDNA